MKPTQGIPAARSAANLGEARGIHSPGDSAECHDFRLRLKIEIPERALPTPEQGLQTGFPYPDGVPREQHVIGLKAVRQVAHGASPEWARVPHPADCVHQAAGVAEPADRSRDGRFRLVTAAGSKDDYSHAPSIAIR